MNRNIVIKRTVGLGDTVFALAAATALKSETPGVNIWYQGPPQREDWVRHCTAIECGMHIPPLAEDIDLDSIDVASDECRSLLMARKIGVRDFKGSVLHFDFRKLDHWADHILLTPFGGASVVTRSFPSKVVDALATELKQRRPVVMFARKSVWLASPVAGALRWNELCGMSEAQMVQIALSCRACIGVDQGVSHLTALAGIPTVIVFTHVASAARAAFHPATTVSLEPRDLSCSPCGDFADQPPCAGTPGYAACAKQISVERLLDAYRSLGA